MNAYHYIIVLLWITHLPEILAEEDGLKLSEYYEDCTSLQENTTSPCTGKIPSPLGSTPIGEKCNGDDDCVAIGRSECNLVIYICRCLPGYITKSDNRDCLEIRNSLGDSCSEAAQCQRGTPGQLSDCIGNKCSCGSGGVNAPGQNICLRKGILVGDACVHNVQCQANLGLLSECSGTSCSCPKGKAVASVDKRQCLAVLNKIGDVCTEPQQCQEGVPGVHSDCLRSGLTKICNCTEKAVHAKGKHECYLKASQVGGSCDVDEQCHANLSELSECTGSTCVCKDVIGVPKEDKTECLPIINKLGSECLEPQQCQKGEPGRWSDCIADWDVESDTIGDPCEVQSQCTFNLGSLTECSSENVCKCLDGALPSGDKKRCLHGPILIGGPCQDPAQCVDTALCSLGGTCSCETGFIPSAKLDKCLKICNSIGDICEEPMQCQQGRPGQWSDCNVDPLVPSNKICNCTNEAIAPAGSHRCYKKANLVGDPCEIQDQCVVNLEFSQCLTGSCSCFEGYVSSTDKLKCISKSFLGESCYDVEQCKHIPFSASCYLKDPQNPSGGSECRCDEDFINPPGVFNLCLSLAGIIGDACEAHESQCSSLVDAHCVDKSCICEDTHTGSDSGKICLEKKPTLNRTCDESVQCMVEHSACQENEFGEKFCTCLEGEYVESEMDLGTCVTIVPEIGLPCNETVQCRAGFGESSDCSSEDDGVTFTCTCKQNYASYDGHCYLSADVGGSCSQNEECHAGSNNLTHCDLQNTQGTCKCLPDALEKDLWCYAKANEVGDSCTILSQCTAKLGDLSECLEGLFCTCMGGAVENSEGTRCIPGDILIGSPCQDSTQCVGQPDHSECGISGACSCLEGFVASTTLSNCLPIVNIIGGECLERHQCQQGNPGPWSDCFSDSSSGLSICNCTSDAVSGPGRNTCYKKAVIVGDSCQIDNQCVANLGFSHCLSGSCACIGNSTASSDKSHCVMKAYLDDPCEDEAQCSHIPYSANCLPINASTPEEGSVCKCTEGYLNPSESSTACYKLATEIGGNCEHDSIQCIGLEGSRCITKNNTCDCNYDYQVVTPDRKRCLEKTLNLNDTCFEDVQCYIENTECVLGTEMEGKICKCKRDKWVESIENKGVCLEVRNEINLPCLETIQCNAGLGEKSECRDKVCQCGYNYVFYDNHCFFAASLGGICNLQEECHAGVNNLTYCSPQDNRCYCLPTAIEIGGTCYADKRIGDNCQKDEECRVTIYGEVYCDRVSHSCVCGLGYYSDSYRQICSQGSNFYFSSSLFVFVGILNMIFSQ